MPYVQGDKIELFQTTEPEYAFRRIAKLRVTRNGVVHLSPPEHYTETLTSLVVEQLPVEVQNNLRKWYDSLPTEQPTPTGRKFDL